MFILKYRKTMRIILIIGFFVFFLFSYNRADELSFVKEAADASGGWKRSTLLDREVLLTDKKNDIAEINFYIPSDGYYQIFSYIYHNWRNYEPVIYFEAIDATGRVYKDRVVLEECWYIENNNAGRWLFHSLSASPFWRLSKGKLLLKFWADALCSSWDNMEIKDGGRREKCPKIDKLDGIIAIESFYLAPVIFLNNQPVSIGYIEPVLESGSWRKTEYSGLFGTDLIYASEANGDALMKFGIPLDSEYIMAISLRKDDGTDIQMIIENDRFRKEFDFPERPGHRTWQIYFLGPLKLPKGIYNIIFKNISFSKRKEEAGVDYIFLIPVVTKWNK